jgi:hypothetical protein
MPEPLFHHLKHALRIHILTEGRRTLVICLLHLVVVVVVVALWLETSSVECLLGGIIDLDTPSASAHDCGWVNRLLSLLLLLLLLLFFLLFFLNTRDCG